MPPPIINVVETTVYADDLAAAEAIYGGVLGLPLIGHEPGRHAFFQVGDAGMLLVFDSPATRLGVDLPPHGSTGAGHFAFGIRADDLDVWRQHLIDSGVAIEKEVVWPRGGHSLYFRDPAGNSAEVITPGVWGTPTGW